jgi:hypothetical protein
MQSFPVMSGSFSVAGVISKHRGPFLGYGRPFWLWGLESLLDPRFFFFFENAIYPFLK